MDEEMQFSQNRKRGNENWHSVFLFSQLFQPTIFQLNTKVLNSTELQQKKFEEVINWKIAIFFLKHTNLLGD